jgi:hypothetical protein
VVTLHLWLGVQKLSLLLESTTTMASPQHRVSEILLEARSFLLFLEAMETPVQRQKVTNNKCLAAVVI